MSSCHGARATGWLCFVVPTSSIDGEDLLALPLVLSNGLGLHERTHDTPWLIAKLLFI